MCHRAAHCLFLFRAQDTSSPAMAVEELRSSGSFQWKLTPGRAPLDLAPRLAPPPPPPAQQPPPLSPRRPAAEAREAVLERSRRRTLPRARDGEAASRHKVRRHGRHVHVVRKKNAWYSYCYRSLRVPQPSPGHPLYQVAGPRRDCSVMQMLRVATVTVCGGETVRANDASRRLKLLHGITGPVNTTP